MQVTEYGRVKAKHAKCKLCGAGVEYTPADLRVRTVHGKEYIFITCPVCKTSIDAENWGE